MTRKWWKEVVDGWDGLENHHRKLLELACRAWDRAEAARLLLERDGLVSSDRFGGLHRHPAVAIENEARAAFGRLVKQLSLDDTEPGHHPRNQWRKPPRRP